MTAKDDILTQDWNDFWSVECHSIDHGMRSNLNSHQGRLTLELLGKLKTRQEGPGGRLRFG